MGGTGRAHAKQNKLESKRQILDHFTHVFEISRKVGRESGNQQNQPTNPWIQTTEGWLPDWGQGGIRTQRGWERAHTQ